jgi:lipopolysaccharide export system protein LptA
MKRALCLSVLMVLAAPVALAQAAATSTAPKQAKAAAKQSGSTAPDLLGSHNSNAPINVSADNFVGDLATKVGTYIGNVIVIQGDMRMRADQVKVNVAQGKPTRIEATGKVVVNAPNGTATGDNGVYELGTRTVTMTGHVVLTKEKDVMRGSKLVMDMNTNLAHLYAQGMPGNRVQGLFIPPPQQQTKSAADKTKKEPEKPARIQQTINPAGPENPPSPQSK